MPQRPSFADAYSQATQPAAPRKSFADVYDGGSASGIDLNHIAELEREYGITPAQPNADDLITRGRNAPRERSSTDAKRGSGEELLQRVLAASPRDWIANAVRYGGGFLSGVPSTIGAVAGVPTGGLSTAAGSGLGALIGGGSEGLAQLIAGEEWDAPAMGVAAGVGAIPMGGIVGTTGRIASRTAGNLAKGALLGGGQEAAYRLGHGELPGRDYGMRELMLPMAMGAGGLGLAGEVGARAANKLGVRGAGAEIPGERVPSDTLRGSTPEARKANYQTDRGIAPRPSFAEAYAAAGPPAPEPLDTSSRGMTVDRSFTQPATPGTSRVNPDPRRVGSPIRPEGSPIDLTGPEPLLPEGDFPAIEGPARPRPVGSDPRAAGSPPVQRTPQQLLEDFMYGRGNRPAVAPEQPPLPVAPWAGGDPTPEFPGAQTVSRAQEALGGGQRPDSRLAEFFGLDRGATAQPAAAFPGSGDVRAARSAIEGGGAPESTLAKFFGLEGADTPRPGPMGAEPGVPGAAAPEPAAPAVPRMTAAQLLERLKGGDPSVRMPGLTGDKLPRDWSDEIRGMLDELNEFPFQRAEVNTNIDDALHGGPGTRDSAQGAGFFANNPDHPNLTQVTAGAPVFHDIMAGKGGTRSAAARGLSRILEGGRPTTMTDRAVEIAQRRLLGDGSLADRALPAANPDVPMSRPGVERDFGSFTGPQVPPAGGAGDDIHPAIRELYDSLVPKWEADLHAQQQRGDPFIIDPTESLEDFARRVTTDPPKKLYSAERKVRKLIDAERGGGDAGFADPSMLMHLGSGGIGALGGAAMDPDNPLEGAVGGGAFGALASVAGNRLLRGAPMSRPTGRPGAAPRPRDFLGDLGAGDPLASAKRVVSTPHADVPNVAPEPRHFLGSDRGAAGAGELGAIDLELLAKLGMTSGGALAGAAFEPEHPFLGAALGGGAGFLASSPSAQKKIAPYLYDAMLSALATPKNISGVTGSILGAAAEHPENAGRILKNFFSGETLGELGRTGKDILGDVSQGRIFTDAAEHGSNRWAAGQTGNVGPVTRMMGAVDQATNHALQRSGYSEGYAKRMTATNDPLSKTGSKILDVARENPVLLPFARTGVDLVEQGLMRTPGVNQLPGVRAMSEASDALPLLDDPGRMSPSMRRSLLGLAAVAGGVGYGAASSEGGPLEGWAGSTAEKMALPGAGLYALPVTAAVAGTRGLMNSGGGALKALNAAQREFWDSLPLPESVSPQEFFSRFAPALGAYTSPVNPKNFDTSQGVFDPMISRLPLINEMLLEQRRRQTSTKTTRR
jgi:hypothetical protein